MCFLGDTKKINDWISEHNISNPTTKPKDKLALNSSFTRLKSPSRRKMTSLLFTCKAQSMFNLELPRNRSWVGSQSNTLICNLCIARASCWLLSHAAFFWNRIETLTKVCHSLLSLFLFPCVFKGSWRNSL